MGKRKPPKKLERPEDVAPVVAARVDYCRRIMVADRWRTGKTARDLAAAWGVATSTVENYSAEASRAFRTPPELVEAARAALAERFHREYRRLRRLGENRSALVALELYGQYAGLAPAKRQELTGPGGGPLQVLDMTKLSDDDLERVARGDAPLAAGAGGDRTPPAGDGKG